MSRFIDYFKKAANRIYVDDCNCIVCERELSHKNRYGLCVKCSNSFPYNNDKVCLKCGKPIYDEADYCMVCQNAERYFDRVSSPLIYKDCVEKIIINYKFYNKQYLAKYLSSFLFDEYLLRDYNADFIIAVPSTNKVVAERYFNQTALLAEHLSRRLNIPLKDDVVIKIRETKHQAKLGGKMRQDNVKGAYKLIGDIKGKRVLVVDDILTTGATLSEVARTLKKGKPLSVEGLALANAEYKLYME